MSIFGKNNSVRGILSLEPPKPDEREEARTQLNRLSANEARQLFNDLQTIFEVRGLVDTSVNELYPTRAAFMAEVRAVHNDAVRCRMQKIMAPTENSFVGMIFGSVDPYVLQ